ncbi:prion-inhibition and propagation-domain-containing protein [Clohesyomyces aquaticus]|uniref:Prion-inhibition and propagation-domain-containing protein n=1 Tax=Clohesyomyces aquaticus TaxID=1231657 RepID=A0A1Y2A275_9PLEO|nr:prion-inhibition and propagation-domain-containing protein [Clohesyomyces aquaticus]
MSNVSEDVLQIPIQRYGQPIREPGDQLAPGSFDIKFMPNLNQIAYFYLNKRFQKVAVESAKQCEAIWRHQTRNLWRGEWHGASESLDWIKLLSKDEYPPVQNLKKSRERLFQMYIDSSEEDEFPKNRYGVKPNVNASLNNFPFQTLLLLPTRIPAMPVPVEPISLAVGAVALASLFSTYIECFNYFKAGQGLEEDFELLLVKLDVEKTRLLIWGYAVGVLKPEGEGLVPELEET